MSRRFENVTILGVGLLGGSLGLALKARGMAGIIRGVGHRQASVDKALAVGAIDAGYLDVRDAARDAELVVICTPSALVPRMLDDLVLICPRDAVVTDVASTKGFICNLAQVTWPAPRRFIGSHPMTGSEKSGPEYASADLYAGCVTMVEADNGHAPDARAAVLDLWGGVGARVVEVAPEVHDAIVARTSHVPHILAAAVASVAAKQWDIQALVGPGFRDFTRIAGSRPEIWRDNCLTNREAILAALQETAAAVEAFRCALEQGREPALEAFFRAGQSARGEVLGQ
jgi:prephenate dehydrogenase